MKNLYCYDNETIKWENGGINYCLHIWADNDGECNPRDYEHDSIMAYFHSRYRLGDEIDASTVEEFWNNLVYKYCSDEEILDALFNMKLEDTCVVVDENYSDEKRYAICGIGTLFGEKVSEDPMYVGLKYNEIITYVTDEFSIRDCMMLLEKRAVWLPLWTYEHSGITMSCGVRKYPYNDMFDSSYVGWIVTVLSDFNEKNKAIAEKNMELEVEAYNNYLTGEVYGYTLYEQDGFVEDDVEESAEPNWAEIDSCGGFLGDDPVQNGIAYNAGNGLEEAIKNNKYEQGEAKNVVTTSWRF